MSIRNSVASALAVLLMAAALPACGQSSPPQARGGGKLSPEEQAMMFRDAREKVSGLFVRFPLVSEIHVTIDLCQRKFRFDFAHRNRGC